MYKLHNTKVVSVTLSVLTAVFAVSVIAYAATSIGTNLSVDGTATVTGNSTLSGTLSVTGASTFTGAITANGAGTFGNAETDIFLFTGDLHASTTALFTNGFTTYGHWIVDQAATTTVTFNQAGMNFDSNTLVIESGGNRVGVASSSPMQELGVVGDIAAGSAATTTLQLTTSSATIGGCIDMKSATGTAYRMYIGSNDIATTTGVANNRTALVAFWEFGSCQ